MFFDMNYLFILAPALIMAIWAQIKVRSAVSRYSKVPSSSGMTGAQVARAVLDAYGVTGVDIQIAGGMLSDHYDPASRTLRLSEENFHGRSIAAAGIAAHEVGHAIQHKMAYTPLILRQTLAPAAMWGSNLAWILFIAGMFISGWHALSWVGVGLYALAVVFTVVTLPVEYNASKRAREALVQLGLVSTSDRDGVAAVLDSAALTYVAAALTAVLELIYFVLRASGGSRD